MNEQRTHWWPSIDTLVIILSLQSAGKIYQRNQRQVALMSQNNSTLLKV